MLTSEKKPLREEERRFRARGRIKSADCRDKEERKKESSTYISIDTTVSARCAEVCGEPRAEEEVEDEERGTRPQEEPAGC